MTAFVTAQRDPSLTAALLLADCSHHLNVLNLISVRSYQGHPPLIDGPHGISHNLFRDWGGGEIAHIDPVPLLTVSLVSDLVDSSEHLTHLSKQIAEILNAL